MEPFRPSPRAHAAPRDRHRTALARLLIRLARPSGGRMTGRALVLALALTVSLRPGVAFAQPAALSSPIAPTEPTGVSLPPTGMSLPPTEAELASGKRIKEVRIVGNRRVSKDEIDGTLKALRAGKSFLPERVTEDVRALWDSGDYDDIDVEMTATGDEVSLR
ncbi:MAG: hypothetical protein EXR75_17150, partial [Myxococcales bacterium]|nr:hypothetical protein [Myxococcales bacterium]